MRTVHQHLQISRTWHLTPAIASANGGDMKARFVRSVTYRLARPSRRAIFD